MSGIRTGRSSLTSTTFPRTRVLASPRRVSALFAAAFVALAIVHLQSVGAVYPSSGVGIAAWDSRQSNLWILAPQAVILTFLFAVYLLVLLGWENLRFSPTQVLRMGLCAGATAALALPSNSWDLFAYVLAALYLLKVLWLAVHLCAAWALSRVLKDAGLDPGYGLFLFMLNPLLLFELIVNGHNDGLMILFATLAVGALQRGRDTAALLIALLGALVKFPGGVLYVTTALYLIRQRRWRSLASGAAGSVLAVIGVVLLFFPDVRSALVLLDRTPGNSVYADVVNVMRQGGAVPHDVMLRGGLQLVMMGALALFCVWRLTKIDDFGGVVRETSYIMLATLVVFQGSLYPWYVTWLFPFVALLGSARTRYVVLLYSWTILGSYYLYPPLRSAELFQGSVVGRQLRRVLVHGVLVGLVGGRALRATPRPLARWSLLRSGR